MESIRSAAVVTAAGHAEFSGAEDPNFVIPDNVQDEFDDEFDAMVGAWAAEQGEYDETQECLDVLVESRAVMAAMFAREQHALARLQAIALEPRAVDATAANTTAAGAGAVDASAVRDGARSKEISWRSMAAEISVTIGLADRTVQTMMGAATAFVESLPLTLEALETGRISPAHARVIRENAQGIDGAARSEFEKLMIDRAETTTPGKLAKSARIAAARLRTETFEELHTEACETRGVFIRDLDNGMSELLHVLPTVFAAAAYDRLTRQAKAVAATGDPRTRDQLRSDLATDLLLTGEPATGETAPHTAAEGIQAKISITIPALTLLGEGNEPATLTGRGPIDLDTALLLTSQVPEFTRVLTDPVTDMVIAADTYRPSKSLRDFLAARDKHCQFPGCNRDAKWCDIDHTIAWDDGGKSVPENLAHLCRWHHMLKHHSRWKVRQIAPGVLEWMSPQGRIVSSIINGAQPPEQPGPRFRYEDAPPHF